jgi:hypothetical protein
VVEEAKGEVEGHLERDGVCTLLGRLSCGLAFVDTVWCCEAHGSFREN